MTPVCRAQPLLYWSRPGEARSNGQFDGLLVKGTDGRILFAGAVMEYDVSEVRLENAETDAGNQEVIELSTDLLGQVGGGTGEVTV